MQIQSRRRLSNTQPLMDSICAACISPTLSLPLCHRIILWRERSLGQMDEHVPPLLQGAAQSVAVQLASYGEGERAGDALCVSRSHVEGTHRKGWQAS